ncbi:class II fructose-bisphosphate aldolase [Candidatus Kaiserbacteria bacterium]|nr:class II fructose-bisphosphate aldolase [Candidatus Kaiserbacteria bacterium]
MESLREVLQHAASNGRAVGHFNVSDSTQFNAIYAAAKELDAPVIIGVSEGERDFIGVHQIAALVRAVREKEDYPIFLNADHHHSIDGCKAAIDAGFDAVIIDGAKLSEEENTAQTKQVVAYARACGRDVIVEAELGYIGTSSTLLDAVPEGAGLDMTTPELAERFVKATGIDLLAPSVGNIHGMLKHVPEPRLDIPRIEAIAQICGVPLVLHGGSGNSEEDFIAAIKVGMRIVHINTEIRVAYRSGIEQALGDDPEEVAPYKYLGHGRDAVKDIVYKKIKLFGNL